MANQEQVERLKQDIKGWNQWRKKSEKIPDLSGANLSKANLIEANLSRSILIGSDLSHADLSHADLSHADLTEADLSHADLTKAIFSRATLKRATLSEAYLDSAHLSDANLSEADLSGAHLSRANLLATNLSYSSLLRADLSGAHLIGAHLSHADLTEANLSHVNLWDTIFRHVDLSTTKGLTIINHMGPSIVELFNVRLPQDGSALQFLRGCGVPDEWIDHWRTIMMHPIQYYSCFISYSSKDEMVAKRLHADLQAEGVRCWFAPEDMKIGDKLHRRIDDAIHLQDKLLLLLSQNAMESDWVENEVLTALDKEQRQGRDVLFPVRLDESVMQGTQPWVKHLRLKRHIGDFTKWKEPEAYQTAFARLLHDLKQDEKPS